MEKVSKAYAMLHAKCPRCRKGDLFAHSMYGFHIQKMYETCPYCGFLFEQEPGYFYVAMYASYALNVAEIVATVIAVYTFTGNLESPWLYIAVIFGVSFILSPFNFRYSRVMLLYWLTPKQVKYQPDIKPVAQGNKTSNNPKLN
jgi:uncharacterized protein (DUF983 family)